MTTRSIRAYRRLSGAIAAEIKVTVDSQPATAWQIQNINGKYPYAIIDGHRYDLQTHEVMALRKAVRDIC